MFAIFFVILSLNFLFRGAQTIIVSNFLYICVVIDSFHFVQLALAGEEGICVNGVDTIILCPISVNGVDTNYFCSSSFVKNPQQLKKIFFKYR